MIIDSFLFFQELELLEIRLEYLYPVVDKFIIVEAQQSFKGDLKEYVFENNIDRYKKYIDKIIYFKIEDIHYNFIDLINHLDSKNKAIFRKISGFLKSHDFYDKKNLSHILDTYHRECIHIVLNKVAVNKDIIVLSDLDEIPNFQIIKNFQEGGKLDKKMVFQQHEFQYFLNNYSNSNWYGSIISPYKFLKNISFNTLRSSSHKLPIISNSGYHFTSIGNKKRIINKIESWAHQEFNNDIIKKNLEENLIHGKDIFYRFSVQKNKCLNLKRNEIIDNRMSELILQFKDLTIKKLKNSKFFNLKYFYFQMLFNIIRIIRNPNKFFLKIFRFSLLNK